MERIRFTLILLVFALIIVSSCIYADTQPQDEAKYVLPNTAIALPDDCNVKIRWVSPPLDPKLVDDTPWYSLCFTVDSTGKPWIGYQEKCIISPIRQYRFEMPIRYTSLGCLENGAFLITTESDLCFITPPAKLTTTYDGLPAAIYQPIANLPAPESKMFPGAGNCVYLVESHLDSGSIVFLLQADKTGIHGYRKIFSSQNQVTAVTGDGNSTFISMGNVIIKVAGSDGTVTKIFTDHQEYVTNMSYSSGTGLYFSTNTGIGFIGAKGYMRIMSVPESKIVYQKGTLYILLKNSLGILALDNIDDLKRFNRTVNEVPVAESKDIKITNVRFFEAGNDVPQYDARIYSDKFDHATTRYVYCQVDIDNLQYNKANQKQTLTMELYRSGRKEMLLLEDVSFNMTKDMSSMWGWARFGSEEQGSLYPDKYTVKIYLNGTLVKENNFTLIGEPDIIKAVSHDDAATVNRLIKAGVNLNSTTSTGYTPLMLAAFTANTEILKLLIDTGVDINAKNQDGDTALIINSDIWGDNIAITQLLINAGADPNLQGKEGKTALHKAVSGYKAAVTRFLMENGAKPDIKDNNGLTPMLASNLNNSYNANATAKITEILLANKANPEEKDKYGNTALYCAIEGRNLDAVSALLKYGANVNAVGRKYGSTVQSILGNALDQYNIFARYRGDREALAGILNLLQSKGADFDTSEYARVYFRGIDKLLDTRHMSRLLEMSESAASDFQPDDPYLRKADIRGLLNAACRQISEAKDDYGYYSALNLLQEAETRARKWGLISSCPEIFFNIGLVNAQVGSKDDAKKYLKDYLDMAPTGSCASRARELINQLQ